MYLNVYIPFTPNKLKRHSMLKKRVSGKATKQEANLCMKKTSGWEKACLNICRRRPECQQMKENVLRIMHLPVNQLNTKYPP